MDYAPPIASMGVIGAMLHLLAHSWLAPSIASLLNGSDGWERKIGESFTLS